MPTIKRSALVSHSADAMYELVNDVASYPEFLPWCTAARILSQYENVIEARLELAKGKIKYHFVTRNTLLANKEIDMELVEGPFKHLCGRWHFDVLAERACKVSLDLEFEFSSRFIEMLFGKFFHEVANRMVDAFCKRADDLYG